ncbi:MAG: hypothetical protein ACOX3G_06780 [Armatimonadota bacterium]
MKRLSIIALLLLFIGLIAGCGGGGSKSQTGESPWYGSLLGVATTPEDGDHYVPVDAWIHIYWPDSRFPPPQTFRLVLEKGESGDRWGAVHTKYSKADSDPAGGSWWFEPSSQFSPNTWYRITLTIPNRPSERVVAYFYTGGGYYGVQGQKSSPSDKPGKSYRPEGATSADGEPMDSQTITTTD